MPSLSGIASRLSGGLYMVGFGSFYLVSFSTLLSHSIWHIRKGGLVSPRGNLAHMGVSFQALASILASDVNLENHHFDGWCWDESVYAHADNIRVRLPYTISSQHQGARDGLREKKNINININI